MAERKDLFDMAMGDLMGLELGSLVEALVTIKDQFKAKLVDEDHPRPETWDRYGGISAYNDGIRKEYSIRRAALIDELNRRERKYMTNPGPPLRFD